jgi:taurine dioxygenase
MVIAINPLSSVTGAEVLNFDAGGDVSAADMATLRSAWLQYGVLVFRNQQLSPTAQERFSRRFGPLQSHILKQYLLPESPYVLVLSNRVIDGKPVGLEDAGRYWHTDVSYEATPPDGSLLYALEIPPTGGDTLFANQYHAYEMMPPQLRARIAHLRARHVFNYAKLQAQAGSARVPLTAEQQRQLTGAVHPVVRMHPETKRPALYVNPGFTICIEEMSQTESAALLKELFGYATHHDVIYRHLWKPHDAVLWDNRCLMHHATTYESHYIRHMHRTTISQS